MAMLEEELAKLKEVRTTEAERELETARQAWDAERLALQNRIQRLTRDKGEATEEREPSSTDGKNSGVGVVLRFLGLHVLKSTATNITAKATRLAESETEYVTFKVSWKTRGGIKTGEDIEYEALEVAGAAGEYVPEYATAKLTTTQEQLPVLVARIVDGLNKKR
jgi:hypothetical protein